MGEDDDGQGEPKTTTRNPLDHVGQDLTLPELVKLVALTPLVVARLLALVLVLVPVAGLGRFVVARVQDRRALPSWRQRAIALFLRVVGRSYHALLGNVLITVRGTPVSHHNGEKVVNVCNHISPFDSSVALFVFPFAVAGVAKASARKLPVLGPAFEGAGFCFVDRAKGGGTQAVVDHVNDPALPNLCIAAEGTTTNGTSLLRFRTGAFVPGHPIQPFVLRFPHRFFNPALTEINHLFLMWRLLGSLYIRCEVTVLPVYAPSEEEKADPQLFADNVRKYIATRAGLPLVDVRGDQLLRREFDGLQPWRKWRFRWW